MLIECLTIYTLYAYFMNKLNNLCFLIIKTELEEIIKEIIKV